MYSNKYVLFDVLFLLVLCLGAFLIYDVHNELEVTYHDTTTFSFLNGSFGNYPYPLHIDAWNHLALTRQIVDTGGFSNSNPYEAGNVFFHDSQKGFHIFLASLLLLLPVSLLDLSLFVPALIFFISALLVYLYFSRHERRFVAGTLFAALFLFIPSNLNILGSWFLVPSNMVFLFFASLLLLFDEHLPELNRFIFLLLLFALALFVYPASIPLLALFVACFYLADFSRVESFFIEVKKSYLRLSAFLVAVLAVLALLFFSWDSLFFPLGWTDISTSFNLINTVPWIFIVLTLIAMFFFWKQKFHLFLAMGAFSLFALFNSLLYFSSGSTLGLPYQRMLMQWSLLVIFSAVFAIDFLTEKSLLYLQKIRSYDYYDFFITLVLLIILFVCLIPSYYVDVDDDHPFQKIVTDDLLFLLNGVPGGQQLILANPFLSTAIYPLTGHKSVAIIPANVGSSIHMNVYYEFIQATCLDKAALKEQYAFDYLITDKSFSCDFISVERVAGDFFLYGFNFSERGDLQ